MKTYILYIATLLAAFALPATAQTDGINTKAIPDAPAMPYKLSLVTSGGNNGTVKVEDANAGGGITIAGSDTLVYGASGSGSDNPNATTVKLTVTPNAGYVVRKDYPKAYKTGNSNVALTLTDSKFSMPAHPVTVEIAYATPVTQVAAITLKAETATPEAVIALLPARIHITLANGHKDSLEVASPGGWSFKASGSTGDGMPTYDRTPGAVNRFTATLAADALPDTIDKGTVLTADGETYTAVVLVANQAEALKPADPDQSKDKGLVVSGGTGDNLNGKLDEEEIPFNGTIEETKVKSIEVDGTVKDAILTLKDVTVSGGDDPAAAKTEVQSGANLTLRLEGTNTLGTLTVGSGASLVLDKAKGAKLEVTTISNSGIFRDSTATVTAVADGIGKLSIEGDLTGGGSVTPNTKVTLTASCTDKAGITTFIWQKRNTDGSYTDTQKKDYDANGTPVETKSGEAFEGIKDSFEPATSSSGSTEYRCLIERTVTKTGEGSSEITATTLLSTQPAKVEVKSGGDPVIPATYYTVTLPALDGFTSNPTPGRHSVEGGNSFSFSLTPAEGSAAPAPIVTTSRGETIGPRESDGKYVISGIHEDITISFTSQPTANEVMATEGIRIQGVSGAVYIRTPQPITTAIYTLSGRPVKQLNLPAGDNRIGLPDGFYIISTGKFRQKVIVR